MSGSFASNGAEIIVDAHGAATASLEVRGTFVGTIELQGTVNGTDWTTIPVKPFLGGSFQASVTTVGLFSASCAGFDRIRARMTAFTSGVAAVALLASNAIFDASLKDGAVAPLIVTNTAAVGLAVTLTLPSVAGLRHYMTYVSIARFATALLTAGTTPVLITTTNLPGGLVFPFPAEAAAQGSIDRYREDFSAPVVASAQNTATTIVCPATPSVIWRVTAGYFLAP